nr:hypothetical protein BaRGS_004532 [Batillaria attramentaria]
MEAESLPGPHTENWRSNASGGKTVYVTSTNLKLTFPMCLPSDVTADVTVVYSKDGLDQDNITVQVGGTQVGSFLTVAESNGGQYWNFFRSHSINGVSLGRGLRRLSLTFPSVSQYGVEIDYVEVKVYDEFINKKVFNCSLVQGAEPTFSASQAQGLGNGYMEQNSYVTPCPEEDNVHLSVYHDTVSSYTLTATNPLYRSFYDEKLPDTSTCPNLDATYWLFPQVDSSNIGTSVDASIPTNNPNNATVTGETVSNDAVYISKFAVDFDLKGFTTGFVDADIHSELKIRFTSIPSAGVSVKVTYKGKVQTTETVLEEFDISADTDKKWDIPEMTWSEDDANNVYIYVSDDVVMEDVQLVRGVMTEEKLEIFKSDAVVLEGTRVNFWWRRPAGENLKVEVDQGPVFTDLAYIAIMVPVPWGGANNWQQIFVLYQDGNVRLVPVPYASPTPGHTTPFGTSVIVGKSNPNELRPAAGIQRLVFKPKTFQMTLTYYDGSTSDLTLTYNMQTTTLAVSNLNFDSATSGLPFAAFRSMFVEFGNTDSDSVQTDVEGQHHVLGAWTTLNGKEFKVFRSVESRHLTQSPDISLKIEA